MHTRGCVCVFMCVTCYACWFVTMKIVFICVFMRVRESQKMELMAWGKKVPIPLDGTRTCTSGLRAHRASDYTTRAGTPRVSRNKQLMIRHSPTSSIVKHKNALRTTPTAICRTVTDTRRLQGPPLSRKRRVREGRKIELTAWGKKCPFPLTGFEPVPLG